MSESIIGKLNLETLKNVYQGGTTPTSEVVVDNTNNIIYVNSHPDSTYVDERIDAKIALLDNAGQTCATGEVISSVSETDGIISVSKKSLTANDIPTLTHTKISDWDSNIDGKIHLHNYSNVAHEDIRTAISNEATARANADTTLQSNIDAEALARQQADTAESTARSSADTALGGRIDSEAQTRSQADETLLDNIDAEESRAILAETAITQDLTAHKNNTSNPHSVTKAQVDLSDVVNKPMDNTPTTDSLNYITSGGVKSYVDTYGGKIDTITVNGQQSPLPIVNKNVTIPKVKKNGTDITLTNNAFDVIVPTKTSDITNDSDYRTGTQVSTSISTHDTSENAHSYIRGLITSEATARSDADNLRVLISSIVNNTSTTTTNAPLSANMGRELLDLINNLKSIGRFLSNWDCSTGLPTTDPTVSLYTYHTGDYFLISVVSSATPAVNYRPDGPTYTPRVPSTTLETREVAVGDYYVYDGTQWILLANTLKTVTFQNIAGDAYDNTNLASALNNKITKNEAITGATHTKVTYDSKGLVTSGTDLSASDIPNLTLSKITDVTATAQQLNYLNTTTSDVQTLLDAKALKTITVNGHPLSSNVTVTKSDVELGNVDNKSEATIKTDFTGSVASGNTGFPTGGDVYTAIQSHVPSDMIGATADTDGAHGLVPQPHAGDQNKYLQGNGTWATVDALPSQAGQSGKYLTTNGTTASWDTVIVSNTAFGTIITNTTDTQYTFTHNLNAQNVAVQVVNSNYETIQVDVTRTSNSVVTIEFGSAPTSVETYHIYCIAASSSSQIVSGEEVSY